MSLADQEKLIKQITTPQLISILDGRSAILTSQQAVSVLLSRNIPNRIEVIGLILARQKEPETRIAVIKNLSRQIDPHAQELLIKGLRTLDLNELKSIFWSLGKIGDEFALESLGKVDIEGRNELSDSLLRAQRLIAFRNGIKGFEFDESKLPKVAKLISSNTQKMEISTVTEEVLSFHHKRIRVEAPGFIISEKEKIQVTCLKKSLWLLNTTNLDKGIETSDIFEKPNIPMLIFAYAYCTNRPYLYGYVYAQPRRDAAKLFVTRLRGQTTHIGQLKRDGNNLHFELESLETRYSPAAYLAGILKQGGGLDISEARVSKSVEDVTKRRNIPQLVAVKKNGIETIGPLKTNL